MFFFKKRDLADKIKFQFGKFSNVMKLDRILS